MTEDGRFNGQYRALQTDVDNLKVNFHDLRQDIDSRFSNLTSEIKEVGQTFRTSFDMLRESQNANRPDIYKTLGAAVGVGTVLLIIGGAFAGSWKSNLDTNITFTNDKIATSNAVIEKNFASTNASVLAVANALQRLQDTTIPRPELENRISRNDILLHSKMDKDVASEITRRYDAQISMIIADVARIQASMVGRPEHEQHWKQEQDQVLALSSRVTQLARDTAGASANDQIKQLQDQLQALQSKFVVVPSYQRPAEPAPSPKN
jgi:hypothetical protein